MVIALEGMKFYAHHGYYDAERQIGNDFIVDAYITTDLNDNLNDDLTNTVNYELVYSIVKKEMETDSKLLETVAVNILNELQQKFADAVVLRIRVSKLSPPLPGIVQRAFVELERKLK